MKKTNIQTLPDNVFLALAQKVYNACDALMTRMAKFEKNPYGFGGSLSYGWDWPTFSMIFPRKYAAWRKLCNEGKRRASLAKALPKT